MAFRRCTHSVSSCTVSTSASAAMRALERERSLGGARRQRGRDNERIRQRVVGERIERLAEAGPIAKILERLLGRNDAHVGHIRAGAQLLRQRLGPFGSRPSCRGKPTSRTLDSNGRWRCVHFARERSETAAAQAPARSRRRHHGRERILRDASQRTHQRLGMAREPGFYGAAHLTGPRSRPRPRPRWPGGRGCRSRR